MHGSQAAPARVETAARRLAWLALLALGLACRVEALAAEPAHSPQRGTSRALLIGVSEYPALPSSAQLVGPRNDVLLMRSMLQGRGFDAAAIRVLADGVPGAALPTRQNILRELEQLAAVSRAGDVAVVFFAGHGSQQANGDGPAGMTQIILPRDTEAGTAAGPVLQAITEDEIRQRIDAISRQRTHVWAIFDACHSARLVRGGEDPEEGDDVRLRRLRPEQLGQPVVVAREEEAAGRSRALDAPAGAVYFYAAQTTEPTIEMRLPRGPNGVKHGLFTYTLVQSLAGGAGMTYQQLSQAILVRYRAVQDGAGVTPLFSGNALQMPVLDRPAPPVRQWTLRADGRALTADAGQLADLHPGALLAVLPGPTSKLSEMLGYARVVRADVQSAELEPVAHAGRKAATLTDLRGGTAVRLVEASPRLGLAVEADLRACGSPCPFGGVITQLRAAPGAGIQWVDRGGDVRLVAVDRRLWILPAAVPGRPCSSGGLAERTACAKTLARHAPSLEALADAREAALAAELTTSLQAVAHATRLLRTASGLATQAEVPFDAEVHIVRAADAPQPMRTGEVAQLRHGDRVRVLWHNRGNVPLDVTALHLDARYGIKVLYPPAGALNRVPPNERAGFQLKLNAEETDGLEQLILVTVPAQRHGERADFTTLAQETLPAVLQVRGGGPEGGVIRVLSWRLSR